MRGQRDALQHLETAETLVHILGQQRGDRLRRRIWRRAHSLSLYIRYSFLSVSCFQSAK
jgi:hypothetical protein